MKYFFLHDYKDCKTLFQLAAETASAPFALVSRSVSPDRVFPGDQPIRSLPAEKHTAAFPRQVHTTPCGELTNGS